MKGYLFLLILGFTHLAYCQKGNIKINAICGINLATLVGPDVKQARNDMDEYDKENASKDGWKYSGSINPRVGFHFGGNLEYYLTNRLMASTGLIYSQRGWQHKEKWEFNETYPISYKDKENYLMKVKLNYIDIPLGVKYFVTDHFFINGGFLFGVNITDKYVEKTEFVTTEYVGWDRVVVNNTEEETGSVSAKGLLAGFQVGAGIQKGKVGLALNVSQTNKPLSAIGISFGYPNLTFHLGVSYRLFQKISNP